MKTLLIFNDSLHTRYFLLDEKFEHLKSTVRQCSNFKPHYDSKDDVYNAYELVKACVSKDGTYIPSSIDKFWHHCLVESEVTLPIKIRVDEVISIG